MKDILLIDPHKYLKYLKMLVPQNNKKYWQIANQFTKLKKKYLNVNILFKNSHYLFILKKSLVFQKVYVFTLINKIG